MICICAKRIQACLCVNVFVCMCVYVCLHHKLGVLLTFPIKKDTAHIQAFLYACAFVYMLCMCNFLAFIYHEPNVYRCVCLVCVYLHKCIERVYIYSFTCICTYTHRNTYMHVCVVRRDT